MRPRYNIGRQDRLRGRKVETEGGAKPRRDGTVECPSCGCWVGNPARLHRNAFGGDCKIVEVELTEIPPVNLPKPRASSAAPASPTGKGNGVRAWGTCETCDASVTGERRFCGLCLANRMDERNRR